MRLHGMDEEEFAKTVHSLISNLSSDGDNSKPLLDGLKEWGGDILLRTAAQIARRTRRP
jgi:hypothetical protein